MELRYCEKCGDIIQVEGTAETPDPSEHFVCRKCQGVAEAPRGPEKTFFDGILDKTALNLFSASTIAMKRKEQFEKDASSGQLRLEDGSEQGPGSPAGSSAPAPTAKKLQFRCLHCRTCLLVRPVERTSRMVCPRCKGNLYIDPSGLVSKSPPAPPERAAPGARPAGPPAPTASLPTRMGNAAEPAAPPAAPGAAPSSSTERGRSGRVAFRSTATDPRKESASKEPERAVPPEPRLSKEPSGEAPTASPRGDPGSARLRSSATRGTPPIERRTSSPAVPGLEPEDLNDEGPLPRLRPNRSISETAAAMPPASGEPELEPSGETNGQDMELDLDEVEDLGRPLPEGPSPDSAAVAAPARAPVRAQPPPSPRVRITMLAAAFFLAGLIGAPLLIPDASCLRWTGELKVAPGGPTLRYHLERLGAAIERGRKAVIELPGRLLGGERESSAARPVH